MNGCVKCGRPARPGDLVEFPARVKTVLDDGAPYELVPNLGGYPKQRAWVHVMCDDPQADGRSFVGRILARLTGS